MNDTQSGAGTMQPALGQRPVWARTPATRERLARGFASLINSNSAEQQSDTPDFLLGEYLMGCLEAYERTVRANKHWHRPADPEPPPTERETDVCHWCGSIRGDHYHSQPEGVPVLRAQCGGLRSGFLAKGEGPATESLGKFEPCRWCGKTYAEHLESRPVTAPIPRMPCTGLRSGFMPRQPRDQVIGARMSIIGMTMDPEPTRDFEAEVPALELGSRFYHRRADLFGTITSLGVGLPPESGGPAPIIATVAYEYPHDGTPAVALFSELESAAGKG